MSKKVKINRPERCGECSHGTWIDKHSNMDLDGKPICLRCPFSDRARIRTESACNNFERR